MTGTFLEKYSLGVGDRFAHQAKPQLAACMKAAEKGVTVAPVVGVDSVGAARVAGAGVDRVKLQMLDQGP